MKAGGIVVSYNLQPWVIGAVAATRSRRPQRREGRANASTTLDIKKSSKDTGNPCSKSLCCPASDKTQFRADVDSGTSLWNANVRVVSTETVPNALLDIPVSYDPTPSFLPTFWRGHSMARQTTPLCLGSLPAPQYTMSTPRRSVQTALGTTS